MPLISVGVPAYNEAELLAGSLEALRIQTFGDFEVLILDNASTDDTARIAADFAARDSRFHHIRQPFNKGEFRNFHEAVQLATSPYFMWRACDDRSDPNYLEALSKLLNDNPQKDLAVGQVRTMDIDGGRAQLFQFPNLEGGATYLNRARYLLGARAGWYYGLYRRDAILNRMNEVVSAYRNLWGFDYLVLLGFLLDDKVIGTNATTFEQVRKRTSQTQRKNRTDEERDRLIYLRRRFLEVAHQILAQRVTSPIARKLYAPILFAFTDRKLFKFRRLVWRMMTRPATAGTSQQDDLAQA